MEETKTEAESKGELIMNIPVSLSVELGRSKMKVKDIMSLAPGAVVELDKPVEEPVSLYANGKLIAKGEVVVVENALGIKITEVLAH
jgi:flagellar motor switch protein FliN/FliY